jgi:DNA processing protein
MKVGDLAEFDADDERQARVAWSSLVEPGDRAAQRLVADVGPVRALRRVLAGSGDDRWRVRLPELNPRRDLRTLRRFDGRLVIPGDPEWPLALTALGPDAPFCLYVRGPLDVSTASVRAAAIVGARACTPYGEHVAAELADGCALRGITVVSGAAYGIDGAAHKGALAGGGPTIAVLACGVDRAYPKGHEQLLERIAVMGAVVSEVPPGRSPTRWRFVERNRLIAALSRVTLVVEASRHSGARGTAMRAQHMGLPVAAVPGPVTSPASYGCHRLIREDGAICVTSADELAELAAPMGEFLADPPPERSGPLQELDPAERRVVDALPARSPASVSSITRAAGLVNEDVTAALKRLEALGLAVQEGAGGWRREGALH